MFYSQFILAKKGPLGTIWIAAHLERKLRKNQVTETNISVSVDSILFPEVPIALRLSGHLLLGVVRIYSRKVNYLFHDCSEALVKIKQAFHAGAVDLPPEAATAPFHSITMPETFELDEFEPLPDRELQIHGGVDHHVSSREQITLQDPLEDDLYLGPQFELDERFPEGDAPREVDFEEDLLDKPTQEASPVAVTLEEEEEGVALEEDILPPATINYSLDYDQLDRMDAMDIDDHHEPGTPALGFDQMDLDYQQEVDGVEHDNMYHSPDILEQLEPDIQLNHQDLDNLEVEVNEPGRLEPGTPGAIACEQEEKEDSQVGEVMEERIESQEEEERVGMQEQQWKIEEEQEEKVEKQEKQEEQEEQEEDKGDEHEEEKVKKQEENILDMLTEEEGKIEKEQKNAGNQERVELEEKQDVSEVEICRNHEEKVEHKEVPEYETVMSAPEITNQESDVFDLDNDMDMETDAPAMHYQDVDQVEETDPILEEEKIPHVQEGPVIAPVSPMRSPSFPIISSDDLPGDDDVLATLLGATPAFKVLPTPVQTVVSKPRRKLNQRKRKIVLDMSTILGADVMKQQLMNTDDIRRVRRKAPCTRRELWSVQKDVLGQQIFSEHSVPGLCGELRVLFERVYVVGDAKLPLAEAVEPDVGTSEELPEPQLGIFVEDLNMGVYEVDKPLAQSPVVEAEVQLASDEDRQPDVTDAVTLDGVEGSLPIMTGETSVGEMQIAGSPAIALEQEEPPNSLLKEDNVLDVLEAELHPTDVTSLSLEEVETCLGVEDQRLSYLPEENIEEKLTEVREAVDIHGLVEVDAEGVVVPAILVEINAGDGNDVGARKEMAVETFTETESVAKVEMDAEVRVGFKVATEAGVEFPIETGDVIVESGPVSDVMVDHVAVEDEPVTVAVDVDVEPEADIEAETELLETHQEADIQVVKDLEEPKATTPGKENEAEVTSPPAIADLPAEEEIEMEEFDFLGDGRDTEFLGADDDDLGTEAEDFQDANEYTQEEFAQDNSGWSARTRAVGQYFRTVLQDKETYMRRKQENGIARLGLERMLVGKSRKEAARMFFETLVLKTKDYIHVEQDSPYDDIKVSSRPKLMKAKF